MTYKPTGYGPGRPRKGEIRPNNQKALNNAQYRANWKESDPEGFARHNREVAAEWRANNLERAREIDRNSKRRAAGWKHVDAKNKVNDLNIVNLIHSLPDEK